MFFALVFVLLAPTSHCANILGAFIFPSVSHLRFCNELMKELSLRGHQVTLITPIPINDKSLTNLTEITIGVEKNVLEKQNYQKTFYKDLDSCYIMKNLFEHLSDIAETMLNNNQFKNFLQDNSQNFDLLLVQIIHPIMITLAHKFQVPVIGIQAMSLFSDHHQFVGYPHHPVLQPNFMLSRTPGKLTLWNKFESIYFLLCTKYNYNNFLLPGAQHLAMKYFGSDMPYIGDLLRNVNMFFVNSNPLIQFVRPTVPGVVELLPMTTSTTPTPLPKDLQKVLDQSEEGVIYISFGSNFIISTMETRIRNAILSAIADLPYKVFLKWDTEIFPENISNVITREWFPQNNVLAHPNIKAFVTHGGLHSMEEAIGRGVPLIALPFYADQPDNARSIVDLGIGERLNPTNLIAEELKTTIIKVATTPSYKNKIKEVRNILFDRHRSGLEAAVWWSEYVIRHKGAKHLKLLHVDVPWFEYFLVDVVVIVVVTILMSVYLFYKTMSVLQCR